MNKKELLNKVESQRKDIDYWKKQVQELKAKIEKLETYQRGFTDATYYLGGKK